MKRVISILLVLVLTAGLIAVMPVTASAEDSLSDISAKTSQYITVRTFSVNYYFGGDPRTDEYEMPVLKNITGPDVKKIRSSINKIYSDAISRYKSLYAKKADYEPETFVHAYLFGSYLGIFIRENSQNESIQTVHTFRINVKTGKGISTSELFDYMGITAQAAKQSALQQIRKDFIESWWIERDYGDQIETIYDQQRFNYILDDNGNLLYALSLPGYYPIFRVKNHLTKLGTPKIAKLQSQLGGVRIAIAKVAGAERYRIFRKTNGGAWKALADTESRVYLDKTAKFDVKYTYTARCISQNGRKYLSAFDKKGKTITHYVAPKITRFVNLRGGTKLSFTKVTGAKKYRVFIKNGSKWVKLADTASYSYVYKGVNPGRKYTYTVRALNASGRYIGTYDKTGRSYLYIAAPGAPALTNTVSGVQLRWKKSAGAVKYRIYRRIGSGSLSEFADTYRVSYTDDTVQSGYRYSYTVCCITRSGTKVLSAFSKGRSITYVAPVKITKFANTLKGTKITFRKVAGAAKYRVLVKNGTKWRKLADTTSNSYVFKAAVPGKAYTYTVCALNASGKRIGAYDPKGKTYRYIAAPAAPTVQRTSSGAAVRWKKSAGAVKYRILRRTGTGKWGKLADTTALSYVDKTVKRGKKYTYTICCVTADGRALTSAYRSGSSVTIPAASSSSAASSGSTANHASSQTTNNNASSSGGTSTPSSTPSSGNQTPINRLKNYIKTNGKTNSIGLMEVGGYNSVSGDAYDYFTLLEDNTVRLTDMSYDHYADYKTVISGVDLSVSDTASFTVSISYGYNEGRVLYASGTINLKNYAGTSNASNTVSVNYLDYKKAYYSSKGEAKHFVYSTMSKSLQNLDDYLTDLTGLTLSNIGIKRHG